MSEVPGEDFIHYQIFQLTKDLTHKPSLDSTNTHVIEQTQELLVDKIVKSAEEADALIQRKLQGLEVIDITIQIVGFKVFECTHSFKDKISQAQGERNRLLTSLDNRSELSLVLNDLDKQITLLEQELNEKVATFNKEKIELQQQAEAFIFQLDEDFSLLQTRVKEIKDEIEVKTSHMGITQVYLIHERYDPFIKKFDEHIHQYEKLKLTGWRIEYSEVKLAEIIEKEGLVFTPSGRLLTKDGGLITFQEAYDQGYFNDITSALKRIFAFFQDRENVLEQAVAVSTPTYSEGTTPTSKISSEDVRYLKQTVGKALTLGLAEVVAKHPRDPIHYLGHYLFKYRYNQDLEAQQKKEVEELTKQRNILAQERWKKMVEDEARHAVVEMILRAEAIGIENELKRIEREQMLALEEEEEGQEQEEKIDELVEEAKDKFE